MLVGNPLHFIRVLFFLYNREAPCFYYLENLMLYFRDCLSCLLMHFWQVIVYQFICVQKQMRFEGGACNTSSLLKLC